MDSVHDLGGMDGYGPIRVETGEPVFHDTWESRVYALNTAMGARGVWNIDMGRFAIESLPPRTYVTSSYYELWLAKLESLLAEHSAKLADGPTFTVTDVPRVLARGSYVRPPAAAARFGVGDRVRARNIHPHLHTRLPRYVRGHVGVIRRVHQPNIFPDSVVRGDGEDPQWLYTVGFDGRELWGDDAEAGTEVSVEAFEPYLDSA
jgi:nitrile hydratase beta subunit